MSTDTKNAPITTLKPVASLKWDTAGDGTFYAQMTVSGLRTERQAQAAVAHMQRLFCEQEQEAHHD